MKSSNCLKFSDLVAYLKSRDEPAGRTLRHLNACARCREELEFVQAWLERIASRPPISSIRAGSHVTYATMEAFFQGTLPEGEKAQVYGHLAVCSSCWQAFDRMLRAAREGIPSEAWEELDEIEATEVEDRLTAYREQFRPQVKKAAARTRGWGVTIRLPRPVWAYAAAAVVLVGLFVAPELYQRYQRWQTQRVAESYLTQWFAQKKLSYESLRPTGGFGVTLVTAQRSESKPADLDGALSDALHHALKLEPGNARYYHYLGTIHFFNNRMERAEQFYRQALALDSTDARIYNDLALIEVDRQRFEAARRLLKRALALDPDLLEAHYNLAAVAELLGERDAAVRLWQHYLSLDADPASPWNRAARTRLMQLTHE